MGLVLVNSKVLVNLYKMVVRMERQIKELSELSESNKEWLTVSDLKAIYGISRKVFDSYRAKGLNVRQVKVNGKILIRKSDIDKFLGRK